MRTLVSAVLKRATRRRATAGLVVWGLILCSHGEAQGQAGNTLVTQQEEQTEEASDNDPPEREVIPFPVLISDPTNGFGDGLLTLALCSATAGLPQEPGASAGSDGAELAVGEQDDDEPMLAIYWDQGLHVEALHKSFTLRTAGSVQNDSAAFGTADEERETLIANGVEWRRARVFADGIFARHFNYKFQYDFTSRNPPNLKDAYLGFKAPAIPVEIRGGRFRAPLGLEGYTSGMDTTFMERGLISAFLPARNTGVLLIGDANRQAHNFRGAVGAIRPEDDFGIGLTDLLGVSVRGSYAFRPREGTLIHVGGDYTHRPVDETIRFLARPESDIAPPFVDTGNIVADSADTGMFEFAVVQGPISFQTESAFTQVNRVTSGLETPLLWGGYAFVSYVITGETRPYQEDRANFGRLRPGQPFTGPGGDGHGAFEVAFRVSYLDLEDKDVRGGRLVDLTWGFNLHATRNARVLGNIIWAHQMPTDESTWIAQLRLQWAY